VDISTVNVDKKVLCSYCNKKLCNYKTKSRHEQNCKLKLEKDNNNDIIINELKKQNEKLMSIITKLSEKNTSNIDIKGDNNNNTTNNIQINNFDSETIDYISGKFALNAAKNPIGLLEKFIHMVHFNKKHPENHTVRLLDSKSGLAEVRVKNKWTFVDMNTFLKDMQDSIVNKFELLKENIDDEKLDLYEDYLEKRDILLEDIKILRRLNTRLARK
jgi:hypothetical protein